MDTADLRLVFNSAIVDGFLTGEGSIFNFLPAPPNSAEYLTQRLSGRLSGIQLAQLVHKSTDTLSERQTESLRILSAEGSGIVITGQQVGFMGGPLYTILKIATCAARARELSSELMIPVVPVFWVADTDHDAAEASTAGLQNKDGSPHSVSHWHGDNPHMPISDRTLTPDVSDLCSSLSELVTGPFASEAQNLLNKYQPGRYWTESFLDVIDTALDAWGVLPIRASVLCNQGHHSKILMQDLQEPGRVQTLIEADSSALARFGFETTIKAGTWSFFLTVDGARHRLIPVGEHSVRAGDTLLQTADLHRIAESEPWRFTPTVASRNLVQDSLLPVIATVLGPAELAYNAQLRSAYNYFGITRPGVVLRCSVTLVDPKAERLLKQTDTTPVSFLQPIEKIIQVMNAQLTDCRLPPEHRYQEQIETFLREYRELASNDPGLQAAIEAASANIQKTVSNLRGKIVSALRRADETSEQRIQYLSHVLYPNNMAAERFYSLTHYIGRFGWQSLLALCDVPNNTLSSKHLFLYKDDLITHHC